MSQLAEDKARRTFTFLNARRADLILERFAVDARRQVPALKTPLRRRGAIRGHRSESIGALSDPTVDRSRVYVSGHDKVGSDSGRETRTGPLATEDSRSIEATNKKFVQRQVACVVADGGAPVLSPPAFGHPSEIAPPLAPPR